MALETSLPTRQASGVRVWPGRARLTTPQVGLIFATGWLLVSLGVWTGLEPKAIAPRVLAPICLVPLLAFVALRAAPWLIAIVTVGQTFIKGIGLGQGITRDDPLSLPLLISAGVLGLILLARWSLQGDSRARSLARTGHVAPALLGTASLLGAILFLNLPRSPLPDYGLQKTLGYVVFNLAPLVLMFLLVKRPEDVKQLAIAFAVVGTLGALASAVYLRVTFGSIFGWGGLLKFDQVKFYGLDVYGGVWLARRAGFAAVSAAAAAFLSKRRAHTWLAASAVLFDLFMIFLTGRGPFVSSALALVVFLLLMAFRGRAKRGLILILPAALVIAVLAFDKTAIPAELQIRYERSTVTSELDYYRLNFYKSAWHVFADHPILGVGTGGWQAFYRGPQQVGGNPYPHNLLLELGAETGVIGVVPFLLMVGIAVVAGIRMFRLSSLASGHPIMASWALALLLTAFTNALISGDIFRNDLLWIAVGVVGLMASLGMATGTESRDAHLIPSSN